MIYVTCRNMWSLFLVYGEPTQRTHQENKALQELIFIPRGIPGIFSKSFEPFPKNSRP